MIKINIGCSVLIDLDKKATIKSAKNSITTTKKDQLGRKKRWRKIELAARLWRISF